MAIRKVQLDGFKAGPGAYTLQGPTILTGPNGSGKSRCLEAIRYALTGDVPAGKALDAVALYFPARGGSVEVFDHEGNWIQRGITRDAEKAKVSEVLTTSDTPDKAPEPELRRWKASTLCLNLAELLGLSAPKRREYILALCGSQVESGVEALLLELEREYAKEIGGKGAGADLLLSPPADLDKETLRLVDAWNRSRGLAEVLSANVVKKTSITECCLKLGEVARTERLGAGKMAKEAKSALRELEAQVKGAQGAAAALEAATSKRAMYETKRRQLEGLAAKAQAARDELQRAQAAHDEAKRAAVEAFATQAPDPGPKPAAPGVPAELQAAERAFHAATGKLHAAKEAAARLSLAKDIAAQSLLDIEGLTRQLDQHRAQPIGKLLEHIQPARSQTDRWYTALVSLIDVLAAGWQKQEAAIKAQIDQAAERGRKALAGGGDEKPIKEALEKATHEWEDRRKDVEALQDPGKSGQAAYAVAVHKWEVSETAWRGATAARERAEALLGAAVRTLEKTQARQAQEPQGPLPEDMEAVRVWHEEAIAEEKRAQEAAGALKTVEETSARVVRGTVDEAAWKAFERALARCREKLVGAATAPVLEALGRFLLSAGRAEVPYLELENERGRAIFELGWVRDGHRLPLEALSSGEAAIFTAALSCALAERTTGLRCLLIEAETLDGQNLGLLLRALEPWGASLDALCVTYAIEESIVFDAPPGWHHIDLAAEKGAVPA